MAVCIVVVISTGQKVAVEIAMRKCEEELCSKEIKMSKKKLSDYEKIKRDSIVLDVLFAISTIAIALAAIGLYYV